MIKIVGITNAHIWDGVEMTVDQLVQIMKALETSNFIHTISYYKDGELEVAFIGGNV